MGEVETTPAPRARGRRRVTTELDVERAALDVFESGGFEAVSMAQIAHAAGVSERTVFRYFPTKVDTVLHTAQTFAAAMEAALLDALGAGAGLQQAEEAVASALTELLNNHDDAIDRLRRTRRLALTEPAVRAEVARTAGWGADAHPSEHPLELRLLRAIVAATLATAFDDWAHLEGTSPSAGGGARLLERYRLTRAARSTVLF